MGSIMFKKMVAEVFGTFWLTFGGCGSAVLAAKYFAGSDNIGIGLVGVSLAFGLTVMTMAYAIGHISGCHLNPAVSLGLCISGRFKAAELIPYVIAQVMGAVAGAAVLYLIASGKPDFKLEDGAGTFATNGFADYSASAVWKDGKVVKTGYTMMACLIAEVVLTAFFLLIILGATDKKAPAGFAPIAIGLGLTLIHLIGIPVTNLSVNPARSTGPAVIAMSQGVSGPLGQVWLFWAAPLAGAILGAVVYKIIGPEDGE
jgi:aquaporin Z